VKSFISKKALTLVELVISITISTIVMLIVLTFVADSIETVISSNKKTEIYEDIFSFKDIFNKYARGGYIDQNLLATTATGSQSDIMLMENIDSSK
jgi:Tfp pilus assembly protein FimT